MDHDLIRKILDDLYGYWRSDDRTDTEEAALHLAEDVDRLIVQLAMRDPLIQPMLENYNQMLADTEK